MFTLFPEDVSNQYIYSRVFSGLGAIGVALQNYPAVDLFLRGLLQGSAWSAGISQATALAAGGICSGMVNFWMNVELLEGFFERMNSDSEWKYKELNTWQQIQYFGGIFVFLVTGILFGLMAFAFTMEGPLAILSIAAGLFVAGIMTIQEVETWLDSWGKPNTLDAKTLFQQLGKWCGHIIAAGNVLALSLLFTLSLAEGLIALQVAALPALIAGLAIAFTFGAFTEYYFYNVYLAKFCIDAEKNWAKMLSIPNAWFGLLCVTTNAFVNGALTYAGVELLTGVLVAASVALPPVAAITALAIVSAFFAGSASLILGMAFWIRQNEKKVENAAVQEITPVKKSPLGLLSMFSKNQDMSANDSFSEDDQDKIVTGMTGSKVG